MSPPGGSQGSVLTTDCGTHTVRRSLTPSLLRTSSGYTPVESFAGAGIISGERWLESLPQNITPLRLYSVTDGGGRIHHFETGPAPGAPPQHAMAGLRLWECGHFPADQHTAIRRAIQIAAGGESVDFSVQYRRGMNGAVETIMLDLRARGFSMHGEPAVLVTGSEPSSAEPGARALESASRLLYGASHDLQEPLRMILIYAQLLERRHGTRLDEEGLRLLNVITSAAVRLSRLVTSLLEYARLEMSHADQVLPAAPEATGEIVRAVIDDLRVLIEESGAEFEIGDLPMVNARATDLGQVFQNLISNSIKYRKPNQPPRITIEAAEDGEYWRFCVKDNGVGFSREQADRVFDLFIRFHLESSGTGLGLAMVKRVIDRLGGRIWAEGEPGLGATFYFLIPKRERGSR